MTTVASAPVSAAVSPAVYEWEAARGRLMVAGGTTPAAVHAWDLHEEKKQLQVGLNAKISASMTELVHCVHASVYLIQWCRSGTVRAAQHCNSWRRRGMVGLRCFSRAPLTALSSSLICGAPVAALQQGFNFTKARW